MKQQTGFAVCYYDPEPNILIGAAPDLEPAEEKNSRSAGVPRRALCKGLIVELYTGTAKKGFFRFEFDM